MGGFGERLRGRDGRQPPFWHNDSCRSMPRVLLATLLASVLAAATVGAQPSAADADLAIFTRAVDLQKAGDLEAAAAEYRRFLESQPRNTEALSNLGVVLATLGRYDDAIAAYRKALEFAQD